MDPKRYQQIKRVLMDALEQPQAKRDEWLAQACPDDPELQAEVIQLLAAQTDASFLEHSPTGLDAALSEDEQDAAGQRLGRIRLDRLLARGGMGEVYAATDELLQRPVAVKLMKAALRMSALRRSAFLAEAQVLSGLRHRNICQVYDFFEDQAQDVLVLELIEGQTLRALLQQGGVEQPIEIAMQVAEALAAAHERGIAHRDLKPENVMLTAAGQVKVLDFGLARAEQIPATADPAKPDGDTLGTQIAGTPGYLAPEQARGEPATTASDLWSFGLLLIELLTGKRAFPHSASSEELIARAQRGEASVPGGLPRAETQLLRRLLSADAANRPSAREAREALASIAQRGRRRLRMALVASALLLLTAAGMKYTFDLRQERELALAAQADAEKAQAEAEDLAGFMLGELYTELKKVGKLPLLEPVALKAVDYYGDLRSEAIGGGRGEQALALIRVAEVLDMQGHLKEAISAYQRALEGLQPLAAAKADDPLIQYRLALAERNLGEVLRYAGDYSGSDPHGLRAIELARELTAGLAPGEGPEGEPSAEERWSLLLRAIYLYADSQFRQGRALQALELLDEAKALAIPAVAKIPGLRPHLGDIQYKRCMAYYDSQNPAKVVEACQASFDLDMALAQANPDDAKLQDNRLTAYWMLGRALELGGDLPAALETTRKGTALARLAVERDPGSAETQNGLAVTLVSEGRILRGMGRMAEAQQAFEQVLQITEPLIAAGRDHAIIHNHLIALVMLGRVEEARPYVREVYDSGWRRPEFMQLIDEFDLLPGVERSGKVR
ncbi:MAG: serine/threonine protein kinase [Xanthomonadales bacterium]|nr:serine/threonine protein kinase [Xanthomonadales bacterium]